MSAIALETERRYSVLITPRDENAGTWHTITAASIGEALRGVRSAWFWESAQVGYPREDATVSAIECLGYAH